MRYAFALDRLAEIKRRNFLLTLLISSSLGVSAATAVRADVTIAVDASATVAESVSGNDLATLQDIFQSANTPAEPAIEAVKWIFPEVGMRRMRVLQSDVFCDLDANGNFGYTVSGVFTPNECQPLGWHLHWALDNHLTPHVAVAAFMPQRFISAGAGHNWSPTKLAEYNTYARKLVNYVATTAFGAGATSVVFEVSNELDIEESVPQNWNSTDASTYTLKPLGPYGRWLWWLDPGSYTLNHLPDSVAFTYPYSNSGLTYPLNLDIRRVDQGISPVQHIFADAVADVAADFPGKSLEIAGPALAGMSFFNLPWRPTGIPSLEEVFLDQMLGSGAGGTALNSQLDRFSFHYYGSYEYVDTSVAAPFAKFKTITDTIKAKLTALGRPDVKLFVSEWGPTGDGGSDVNYSHKGAAWVAAFLTRAVAEKVSMGSYLLVSDGLVGAPSMLGQASLLHKYDPGTGDANVHYYPKPAANVFKMFAKMTGTRRAATLSTTGSSSNIGTFVTSDANSASIVVFNYNPTLVFQNNANTLPDTPETFFVDINNLPFNGSVTVQQYLVDANTSNLKAFLASPSNSPDLQMVAGSPFTATVVNGRLILPSYTLGLGVTLYRVTP